MWRWHLTGDHGAGRMAAHDAACVRARGRAVRQVTPVGAVHPYNVRRTKAITNGRNRKGLRSDQAVINSGRVLGFLVCDTPMGGGQQRPVRYRILE